MKDLPIQETLNLRQQWPLDDINWIFKINKEVFNN